MGPFAGTLLSFGLAFFAGRQVVALLWPAHLSDWSHRMLRLVTSFGIGVGIASATNFLSILIVGRASQAIITVDCLLLAISFAVGRWLRRPSASAGHLSARVKPLATLVWLAFAAAALATVGAVLLRVHDGAWDAIAIWNLHAQFLTARSTGAWKALFDPTMMDTHPDYPLLIPAFVARGWTYVGHSIPLVPMALAWLFTAALLVLLTAAVSESRGRWHGALACATIASSPVFLGTALSQYADMPLAFYFLLTIVLLHLADRGTKPSAGLYTLAGVAASMAAFTKNEGSLFIVALVGGRISYVLIAGGLAGNARRLAWVIVGAMPILAVLLVFKSLTPPNYLLTANSDHVWKKLLARPRVLLILEELENEMLRPHSFSVGFVQRIRGWNWHLLATSLFVLIVGIDHRRLLSKISVVAICVAAIGMITDVLIIWKMTGSAGFHWSVAFATALVTVAMGFDLALLRRASFLAPALTLLVINVGYFSVYLATPLDLRWQLKFSIERILFHTMPLTVFLAFLLLPMWRRVRYQNGTHVPITVSANRLQ